MKKGTKVKFKKKYDIPIRNVGGIDEYLEQDDKCILVNPHETYLFIEDNNNKAVIGSFANNKLDWGSCYLTLIVNYNQIICQKQ